MRVHDDWELTPFRAAMHLTTRAAVVADLHLGYGLVRQAGGEAVPDLGWSRLARRLERLWARYRPRRLIVAGDLVESPRGAAAVNPLAAWLAARGLTLELVPGNHDGDLLGLSGLHIHPAGIRLGDWVVCHEDTGDPGPRVVGHWHPVVRATGSKGQAPAYLVGPNRIVLPASSDDAAGVNVLGVREWDGDECWAIVGSRVIRLGEVRALRRRLQRPGRPSGRAAPYRPPR